MGKQQWILRAGALDENKLHVFIFNNFSLALILSLSTSTRGDFLSCAGYLLSNQGNEGVENAKKRNEIK